MSKSKARKAAEEKAAKMSPLELLDEIESYVEFTDEGYRAASNALREYLDGVERVAQ